MGFLDKKMPELGQELKRIKEQYGNINILLAGGTGSGKSSTINALFDERVANVGNIEPETMEIAKYELNGITLWDSPGLGDSAEKDKSHANKIKNKLCDKDKNGKALIDMVLMILPNQRDLGSPYKILKEVILPNISPDRVILAINKVDKMMNNPMSWDYKKNIPTPPLQEHIRQFEDSIRLRIKDECKVDIRPISYAAGYKDEYGEMPPYNLLLLLREIYFRTPTEKRLAVAENVNQTRKNWKSGNTGNAGKEIKDDMNAMYGEDDDVSTCEEVFESAGGMIGSIFGCEKTGKKIGRAIGRVARKILDTLWPF